MRPRNIVLACLATALVLGFAVLGGFRKALLKCPG